MTTQIDIADMVAAAIQFSKQGSMDTSRDSNWLSLKSTICKLLTDDKSIAVNKQLETLKTFSSGMGFRLKVGPIKPRKFREASCVNCANPARSATPPLARIMFRLLINTASETSISPLPFVSIATPVGSPLFEKAVWFPGAAANNAALRFASANHLRLHRSRKHQNQKYNTFHHLLF